jgi:peroxiredoxin
MAPDFTLTDLDDNSITLSSLRGKIVMVNFWATWCVPCINEMPYFQKAHVEWSGDKELVILAVNQLEGKGTVNGFMDSRGYTFTALLDLTGDVADNYSVSNIPKTFFIDADGIIQHIEIGGIDTQSYLYDLLDSL